MQTTQMTLATVAAGMAVLGCLLVLLPLLPVLVRAWRAPGVPATLGVGALAVVLPALLTLPAVRPFAPGFGLGMGLLLGGVPAWLVLAAGSVPLPPARMGALALAAAAVGPALAAWRFHGDPGDVLMGCALGALAVAVLGGGVARAVRVPLARGVEVTAVASSLAVVGVRLAMAHFPRSTPAALAGGYWAVPPLLLAGAALVLLLVGIRAARPWVAGIAGAAAVVLFLLVLHLRLLPGLTWSAPAVGAAAFLVVLGLLAREERDAGPAFRPRTLAVALPLAALITTAFAFRGLAGVGELLALLPALVLVAAVYPAPSEGDEPLTFSLGLGTLTLCALFALTRLLFERYGHVYTLDFQRYYDIFTLLLGVGLTLGINAAVADTPPRPWPAALRLGGLGLAAVGVPLGLLALWGARTLSALLTGLAVGEFLWMALAAGTTGDDRRQTLAGAPHALLLTMAVAAVQLAPRLFVKELTTSKKIIVAVVLTGAVVLWVVVDTLVRSRAHKEALHAAE